MTITLDTATEERIRHELARGRFADVNELIGHAMELVEAEDEGFAETRVAFLARLDESIAQAERGEGFGEEELRARMVARRAAHPLGRIA